MTDSKLASLKSKIASLIAKGNSTTNEHEADAFLAKAEAMLNEHNLSLFDLDDGSDPMFSEVLVNVSLGDPAWKTHLVSALAEYYGATTVRLGSVEMRKLGIFKPRYVTNVIGRESAVLTTKLMYPFVADQINEAGRKLAREVGADVVKATTRVGNAVVARIWRLVRESKAKAPASPVAAKHALVAVDQLKAHVKSMYPDMQEARKVRTITSSAAQTAAAGVSLHRQASGAGQLRIGNK